MGIACLFSSAIEPAGIHLSLLQTGKPIMLVPVAFSQECDEIGRRSRWHNDFARESRQCVASIAAGTPPDTRNCANAR